MIMTTEIVMLTPIIATLSLFAMIPDSTPMRLSDAVPAGICTILPGSDGRTVHINNLWDGGVVPYDFAVDVLPANRVRAREVMDEIEFWSGVRFVPRVGDEPNWVTIRNSPAGQGNSASVGQRAGGVVNMRDWDSRGMILHELMHTLSFLHEQSRADRDLYLDINDCANANGNYNIAPNAPMIGPYDFESVTHYTPLWGCDGEPAYQIREPYFDHYQSSVGTWHYDYRGPSNGDIWALYTLYGGDPVPGPFVYTAPSNAQPVSVDPGSDEVVPVLRWDSAPLADGYRVEVDRSPIFRFPLRTIETPDTSVEIEGLSPGTYYWRCVAINQRGENYPRPKPDDIWSFVIPCGVADMAEPWAQLDFVDVSVFLGAVTDQDPIADLNNDGVINFFDVSRFLTAFADGCP